MVVIRLARFGTKHLPQYRVTVADQKFAAKKRYLEVVGYYNPQPNGKAVGHQLEMEKITTSTISLIRSMLFLKTTKFILIFYLVKLKLILLLMWTSGE